MKRQPTIKILQISDMHLFADKGKTLVGINTALSFEAVLTQIKQENRNADLVILTGDLSQDDSTLSYQYLARCFNSWNCPIFWTSGNHDQPNAAQQALNNTLLQYKKSAIMKNWQLIILNTHWDEHVAGYLPQTELDYLSHALASHSKKFTLIFLHHPPVSVGSAWLDQQLIANAKEFFTIIDKYPCMRSIICGHVHQVFETMRQNVRILTSPSTCFQFSTNSKNFSLDSSMPGYRYLNLYSDGHFTTTIARIPKNKKFLPDKSITFY